MADPQRFRLTRCGVLNVWQYDRQVFEFAGGRLLLRGANGAGKSKTMEMLLPFAIDGDKARLTASGRHHTSLLWLMLDGYDGQARTGYVWVEFSRTAEDGAQETFTCGVGMRATQSARAATAWYFTSSRRVGDGLVLEDDTGPRSRQALEDDLLDDEHGHVFQQAARYREHIGRLLFGLPADQYDDLLRLVYWLRQPQVGEDIDPRRLAEQLVNALPQLDDDALRSAGSTFDELEAYGEQIERRSRAAEALGGFVEVYRTYARAVLARRLQQVIDADAGLRAATTRERRAEAEQVRVRDEIEAVERGRAEAGSAVEGARSAIGSLEAGPEARARATLLEKAERVSALRLRADEAAANRDGARGRAQRRADAARSEAVAVSRRVADLLSELDELGTRVLDAGADTSVRALAEASGVVRSGTDLEWQDPEAASAVRPALDAAGAWLESTEAACGRREAAVGVVRDALRRVVDARRLADAEGRREAEAQHRADDARQRLDEARLSATREQDDFRAAVTGWWREGPGSEPPELDLDELATLSTLARTAVDEELTTRSDEAARARAERAAADAAREDLERTRQDVASQVDPEPIAPHWQRDPRAGRPGAPFWRVVDFADDLDAAQQAGVEAALEGAGLLDAWVAPDGHVDVGLLDAQLASGPAEAASTTADPSSTVSSVLQPDSSGNESGVPGHVVRRLLDRIAVHVDAGSDPAGGSGGVSVGTDGRWRVGPLLGHTTKAAAQYIGAGARAAERERRLAELDVRIDDARRQVGRWAEAARIAQERVDRIRAWLAAQPFHEALVRAWTAVAEREAVHSHATAELDEAAAAARARRAQTAGLQRDLEQLATAHDLPQSEEGLDAVAERLRRARVDTRECRRDCASVLTDLDRWAATADDARVTAAEADAAEAAAARAAAEHGSQHDEYEVLRAAEGEGVRELEARLAELRRRLRSHSARLDELQQEHDDLAGRVGALGEELRSARAAVATARPELDAAHARVAALDDLPGFTDGLGFGGPRGQEADGVPVRLGGRSIPELRALLQAVASGEDLERARNAALQSATALQSGPAAGHEPRHFDQGGVLVAVGRDEGRDLPVVELSGRLSRSVARDRELLTTRERKLFEDHVLGQLGDSLRAVRRKSQDLVDAMNDQLRAVSTSQGIRVRLRWRLRDELPPEARRAVELLRQPLGSLLPGEKDELRDSLHRLIDVSRAEAPEEPYAVHLARALDYRQWNAFTVQYHRPETGDWRDLQRRTALSQGEQKVLCYLPLFAAAAAHFTSVAGAAPHAPRFVLLDDAFPKIDARTHPLLFGLLVQLDLDFVITSERLWGNHPTVPSLAIYEALRSPSERGIAQYEHRWDGYQLAAVGV